jgi:small subunit ribosomal protein S18
MKSKSQNLSSIRKNQKIDYKDVDLLRSYVTDQGKILPRRTTGGSIQHQRKLAKAIKRARTLSLFPFVAFNSI